MIDRFFSDPVTRNRLRSGPLGPLLDDFAAFLLDSQYSKTHAQNYLRYANLLGSYLIDTGRVIADLDEALYAGFEAWLPTSPYVHSNKGAFFALRCGFGVLLEWLRARGDVPRVPPPGDTRPTIVIDFASWMTRVRGTQPASVNQSYGPALVRFVVAHGEVVSAWTPAVIRAFVLAEVGRTSPRRAKTVCTALRMFLRFLATTGRCDTALLGAVPTLANWKKAGLPKHIPRADAERLIASCDRSDPNGRRDHAILLLLCRLGVRAGDVAGLRFEDIDWVKARISVQGKSKRRVALPLPQDVGDAILAYLDDERLTRSRERVFLSCNGPFAPLARGSVTSLVVRRAAAAGVFLPRAGAHVLRHTLATSLLADGMSLEGIGAVLRHESIETTAIYAKVDAHLLTEVARPWPVEVAR